MKYEISNTGKTTGNIRNIANRFNNWILSKAESDTATINSLVCHSRLDRESSIIKLIRRANYKITHISYSVFHISNFEQLKGAQQ